MPTISKIENRAIRLADIIDRHRGEKFLVCGTGPSIDQYHRSFYENWPGVTIGVNDITKLFRPHYYLNIHEANGVLWDWTGTKLPIAYDYFNPSNEADLEKKGFLSMVGTVAFPALTAAYQLGASEIYLIGIDLKVRSDGLTHFAGCSPDVPTPGKYESVMGPTHVIEKVDELRATIYSFEKAIKAYQARGVRVVNLSKDSLLQVA